MGDLIGERRRGRSGGGLWLWRCGRWRGQGGRSRVGGLESHILVSQRLGLGGRCLRWERGGRLGRRERTLGIALGGRQPLSYGEIPYRTRRNSHRVPELVFLRSFG